MKTDSVLTLDKLQELQQRFEALLPAEDRIEKVYVWRSFPAGTVLMKARRILISGNDFDAIPRVDTSMGGLFGIPALFVDSDEAIRLEVMEHFFPTPWLDLSYDSSWGAA